MTKQRAGSVRYCSLCLERDLAFVPGDAAAHFCRRCGEPTRPLPGYWLCERRASGPVGASTFSAEGKKDRIPRISPALARTLLLKHEQLRWRGKSMEELDRRAQGLFKRGLATQKARLIDQLCFVGAYHGGVQERYVPGGYRAQAACIAAAYEGQQRRVRKLLRDMPPLVEAVPDPAQLEDLLAPFRAAKFWIVWGSKFLQLLAPDRFPALNAPVERLLGLGRRKNGLPYYHEFMQRMREQLLASASLLADLPQLGKAGDLSALQVLERLLLVLAMERGLEKKVRAHPKKTAIPAKR